MSFKSQKELMEALLNGATIRKKQTFRMKEDGNIYSDAEEHVHRFNDIYSYQDYEICGTNEEMISDSFVEKLKVKLGMK